MSRQEMIDAALLAGLSGEWGAYFDWLAARGVRYLTLEAVTQHYYAYVNGVWLNSAPSVTAGHAWSYVAHQIGAEPQEGEG